MYGTKYKKPCALVVGVKYGVLPQFGNLEDILFDKDELILIVRLYKTIEFASHFNCFIVELSTELVTITQGALYSHEPHHVRCVQGLTTGTQRAVVLKTHLSSL